MEWVRDTVRLFGLANRVACRLGERIERIERALKAIQGHFEGALNKLDMMERAKLNRSRKMDAIIDHLDEVPYAHIYCMYACLAVLDQFYNQITNNQ